MQLVDHLLVFTFVVLWPLVAVIGYRKFLREVKAGVPGARVKEYLWTIAEQWTLTLAALGWWFSREREARALGLGFGREVPTIAGALLAAVLLFLIARQVRRFPKLSPERLGKLGRSLGDSALLLPATAREQALFCALSLTAGICEEILFRGYLIAYFGTVIGRWPAMLASALAFGLAHAYQGRKGILKTGFAGLFMGALYLVTESLVWPMIVHAAIDVQAGVLGRAIHSRAAPGWQGEAPAGAAS